MTTPCLTTSFYATIIFSRTLTPKKELKVRHWMVSYLFNTNVFHSSTSVLSEMNHTPL